MALRRWIVPLVAVAWAAVSCTSEASTPIDLDATVQPTTTIAPPALPDDDPNAAARNQLIEFAKEQCRLHPEREFGVVIIADADGNEVNRYEHPCDELDVGTADGQE
jgi:hypothetical protein